MDVLARHTTRMVNLKTPLRYPGGKSRALKKLFKFIPDLSTYTEWREPFLGGGSMSIEVIKRYPHIKVWVNDLYYPLYNFWKHLQLEGETLVEYLTALKHTHPVPNDARRLFLHAKEHIGTDKDSFKDAVRFYIINKCSFSGLTENSSFSKQASDSNFSLKGIEKLIHYQEFIKDWKITNQSYTELLTNDMKVFTYLDPPYEIQTNLYGKKGMMHKAFGHDIFSENCSQHEGHQLISYNDSQLIKDRFKGWNSDTFPLTYTLRSKGSYLEDQKKRKELVLYNYGTV